MNNHRLLVWLCAIAISSMDPCSADSREHITTLDDLFEAAEIGNPRLRTAVVAERVAESEIDVAKTARLPDISTSVSLSYIGNGFTTRRNLSDYQKAPIPHFGSGLEVGIKQPVYAGGAITAGIELASLNSSAARLSTELSRSEIRMRLTEYYLNIYKLRNLREVVTASVVQVEMVLNEMKARYEQGTALLNDITRYELMLSGLKLRLINIDNDIKIAMSHLGVIAGLPEDFILDTDTTLLSRSLPIAGVDWWHQEAKINSPVLKIARTGIQISRKSEQLVRAGRRPKVGLEVSWSLNGPILVEIPPINRNL